jgi:hypothetical protein
MSEKDSLSMRRMATSTQSSQKRTSGYRKGGRGSHSGGGTTGKCHTCGQFGHRAAQCKVKAEKALWNYSHTHNNGVPCMR